VKKRPNLNQIAIAAGVSPSTVDRVMNGRGPVSLSSRRKVIEAARELGTLRVPSVPTHFVMHVDVIRTAVDDEYVLRLEHALRMAAPATSPQVVLHFVKELPRTSADWMSMLRATGQRRHGIIMLVHDNEDASEALARLGPAPVPVAALTFDIQTIAHRFYIGIDNEAAARTAAFMIARTSPPRGRVLMLSGPQEFLLHRQRSAAFVEALARLSPGLDLVGPIDMADRSDTARRATLAAMHADSPLVAIYNSGGANIGISRALATTPAMPRPVWIAHEGTPGNLALLKKGEITMILDQDPDAQASAALNYILYANGEIGSAPEANIRFHVLTPENS
jgi:LacI family transcriptional regulator